MSDSITILDVLFWGIVATGTFTGIWILFMKVSKKTLSIIFEEKMIARLRNIRQRCEHRDETEVVCMAIATYDVLTTAAIEGERIFIERQDGTTTTLDLFPTKEERERK